MHMLGNMTAGFVNGLLEGNEEKTEKTEQMQMPKRRRI